MLSFKVDVPKLKSPIQVTRQDMLKIGAKAIQTLTERVAKAQGVNDQRMKKLTPPYKTRKTQIGQPGIRNLMYSGAMLGALSIVDSSDKRVVIGFTRQGERKKAEYNQQKDPWFGISRRDSRVLQDFATRLLKK
jgi:hypothetical protein